MEKAGSILIVKTSSLGDVIHTLPAVTEAYQHYPDWEFAWVVEENFAEIPHWHPAIKQVIPVAWRRWRKQLGKVATWHAWHAYRDKVKAQTYDYVIDAQGLMKSAWLARQAKGQRHGFDWGSAREPFASWFYHHRYPVGKPQHAVERLRQLFSQILNYPLNPIPPDYGITTHFSITAPTPSSTILFFHGTTWDTKHWSNHYWRELAERLAECEYWVRLPWGNPVEYQRACWIAARHPRIQVLPKMDLQTMAKLLTQAQAVVSVDTGLAHLAAALTVPTITLYGATHAELTGTYGINQIHLTADYHCVPCLSKHCRLQKTPIEETPQSYPCYQNLPPQKVWQELRQILPDLPTW